MAHDSTETAAQPGVSLLCTGSAVATGHATGALALAPGMGDKIIDVEFIRELGKKIATAGDAHLPTATTQAQSAQTAMFTAGQAGGLLVVLGFFFAARIRRTRWGTKHGTAEDLSTAAQRHQLAGRRAAQRGRSMSNPYDSMAGGLSTGKPLGQAGSHLHESGSTGLAFLQELEEITYSITPDSW